MKRWIFSLDRWESICIIYLKMTKFANSDKLFVFSLKIKASA